MLRFFAVFLLVTGTSFASPKPYIAQDYSRLIGMPQFSDQLLQMHFKLYEGYVKNANELLQRLQSLNKEGKGSSYEYGALKRRFGWEYDGMRLHELYFGNLGGSGVAMKKSPFYTELSTQFGSFDAWKRDFIATGSMRGIGWAILYYDKIQGRLINTWINVHDVGHLAGGAPLLIMDVFEHAFMPQFGLDRAKYIDAFFANIDWNVVEERFKLSATSPVGQGETKASLRKLPPGSLSNLSP